MLAPLFFCVRRELALISDKLPRPRAAGVGVSAGERFARQRAVIISSAVVDGEFSCSALDAAGARWLTTTTPCRPVIQILFACVQADYRGYVKDALMIKRFPESLMGVMYMPVRR